ncbi:MAG: efflux RND transporter periplasmic adaptor subunit [Alphaproteobacteria bacterium]|nr:efflux RND transporter periplasmic adaptor subunit [Alphaproteobacteria bacterium]
MRKGAIAAALLLAVAAAGAALRLGADRAAPPAAAEEAPAASTAIPVTIGTVAVQDVPRYLQGIGSVQAFNTVSVKSRVDGQIVKVAFTEGQDVKAGDPLVEIDPRPYQAALEQAVAARGKDEAQLVSAQADLQRYSQLVGSGFQTRQSYDQQKAAVAQLQAAIKGDEAQIDAAKLNLSYCDIRSPIDGRLGARLVDIGNLVHATDNAPLVSVTQLKPIFVSFTLPQEALDEIRDNQANGQLSVLAYSADNKRQLAEGRLTLIDNAIDQTTGTIRLKATFDNRDERLWPGAFANLRLVLSIRQNVTTVPAQAVQDGPNGSYVYMVKPDETVQRRAVEVASIQDGIAVVTKGLSPAERIVVEGQYRLTEGAKVKSSAPSSGQNTDAG